MTKPKVAIQSITGCAGCQLSIYFIQDHLLDLLSKIDLVAAPMIQSKNSKGPYDLCFVEGSVSSEDDLIKLNELREKSEILVALGTCSCFGNVQSSLQYRDKKVEIPKKIYKKTEHLKSLKSSRISEHVKVDYSIPGCPPDKGEITFFLKEILSGKKPILEDRPVCYHCILKENNCLIEEGKECLGPLTNGGCKALCPSNNHGCTGCRGPIEDINYVAHKELMKKLGVNEELFIQRVQKYAPKRFEEIIKKF